MTSFPDAAREALRDTQLRRNLTHATHTIRDKRARAVEELPDWDELRAAGQAIKDRTLRHLDSYLVELEQAVQARGGTVHWARDAAEANSIVIALAAGHGATEVVKVKSLATDEIELNEALAGAGIAAIETDLAELIIQLDHDWSSHILVPAIHLGRARDPGDLHARARRDRAERRAGGARRGRPPAPAAGSSSTLGWPSAARTSRWRRPARSPSSSPRATGACA